jgi:peroxiredoxin
MKPWEVILGVALAVAGAGLDGRPAIAAADARVGTDAPDFTAPDAQGRERRLSEFKGRTVVLEWHNQSCPYVKKHYESGNMQRLQKELTGQGVVWLTVISSAPGKQGYVTPAEEDAYLKAQQAAPTAVLFDPDGRIGRSYGARTTPHMFVIDPQGTLVYDGAIDDRPSSDQADVAGAKNFVRAAYQEVKAGKPVSVATTAPYGCSVKYATP